MDTKTLITELSARTSLPPQKVGALVDALGPMLAQACADMDSVALPAFGTFEARRRAERVMVMPGTGRRMLLPPKVVLTFKPSGTLKNRLRGEEGGNK